MHRLQGRKSLAWRLPLLISGLLIAALAAFAFVGYRQLTSVLMVTAKDRVQSAAQLLARTFEAGVPQLRTELTRTADSSVQRFVRTGDPRDRAAADRSITDRISKVPQLIAVELRDNNGKRLLWVNGPAAAKAPWFRDSHVASAPPKGMIVGPIVSDRGTLFREGAAPIVHSTTDTIGTIAEFREVSSQQTAQLIGGLIGSDATLLIGSKSGIWTNLSTVVPAPPNVAKGTPAILYTAPDGSVRVGSSAQVKATPWILWVDIKTSAIMGPARRFLNTMLLAGLIILIVGALGAWLISRRITAPLQEIAFAAKGISTGDYSRRVPLRARQDELGFLADSFNGMAHEIEDSHRDLESRVAARTRELATALEELREAQESLVQKEKLAMLGLLAGGVGHELRNPLGVMTNAVYYLGAVMKDASPEIKEYLGILSTQINLSEKIVGDLLDFARIKPPQKQSVVLKQVVDEQLKRAGPLEGVNVKHDFPEDLPNVRVDRVQIGQVVLNLITNALQAMNGNANLTLRGRRAADGFVRLDVIDTGTGMTADQMEKLFEPLFTTKARGIGLGLAVSRGLVQANGGVISAESKPGAGTTMSVSLPTNDAGAA